MVSNQKKEGWFYRQYLETIKSIERKVDWKALDYFANNFNSISHALGIVLAFVGLVWLSYLSYGKFDHFIGALIFSICAGILFGASALMHFVTESFHVSKKLDALLSDLDHSAIYLLIAGCYTPIMLTSIAEPWKTRMLVMIWIVAFSGILFTQLRRFLPQWMQSRNFQVCNYLVMGWLLAVRLEELYTNLSGWVFSLIFAEGIIYSLGAVVYATKWPNPKPPHFGFHQIWHIFVLVGFICHLVALLFLYGQVT